MAAAQATWRPSPPLRIRPATRPPATRPARGRPCRRRRRAAPGRSREAARSVVAAGRAAAGPPLRQLGAADSVASLAMRIVLVGSIGSRATFPNTERSVAAGPSPAVGVLGVADVDRQHPAGSEPVAGELEELLGGQVERDVRLAVGVDHDHVVAIGGAAQERPRVLGDSAQLRPRRAARSSGGRCRSARRRSRPRRSACRGGSARRRGASCRPPCRGWRRAAAALERGERVDEAGRPSSCRSAPCPRGRCEWTAWPSLSSSRRKPPGYSTTRAYWYSVSVS